MCLLFEIYVLLNLAFVAWLRPLLGIALNIFLSNGFLFKNGVDPASRNLEKPRTVDDIDKTKPWQLTEIAESGQCRLVTLPDNTDTSSKVFFNIFGWYLNAEIFSLFYSML